MNDLFDNSFDSPKKYRCLIIIFLCQRSITFSRDTLREERPYLAFFWSVSFRIRTEYGEIRSGKILTRKTPNTDTFHAVMYMHIRICEAVSHSKMKCFFVKRMKRRNFMAIGVVLLSLLLTLNIFHTMF